VAGRASLRRGTIPPMTVDTERGARRAVLERLVDHAAPFPPASPDMALGLPPA
jgi:hypothetical protein